MSHSIFAIVGPVMVGPSSSHTAGAVRLGNVARSLFGALPEEVDIVLYGSFGEVYDGHSTDKAVVAGVLGLSPNDSRLKDSFEMAKEKGVHVQLVPKPTAGARYHPNTAKFYFRGGERKMMVLGSSVGGGRIEIIKIDDMPVSFDGEHDMVIFTAKKGKNVLPLIQQALGNNAQLLQLFSKDKNDGQTRYVVEVDHVPDYFADEFQKDSDITRISVIPHINLWEAVSDTHIPDLSNLKPNT